MLCQFEALGSERFSIIISKNRIFNHVMAIRMVTWISFIRRREFRNARGIFNQCNRYFCTWKSNVLLHNFRTRQSEFISLSSTLEIHSHTFIIQDNFVEYLIDDRFHDTTVKFTAKLRCEQGSTDQNQNLRNQGPARSPSPGPRKFWKSRTDSDRSLDVGVSGKIEKFENFLFELGSILYILHCPKYCILQIVEEDGHLAKSGRS